MSTEITIRMATAADAATCREIYLPYISETAITFELEDPTLEDFTSRVTGILEAYPYLVAEQDGEVIGYAYASAFRPRAAYRHAAEASIYLRKDCKGNGTGRRLYEALAQLLLLQNVYNLEACIAHCEPADDRVPATSRLFHEKLGFVRVATFEKCARKFKTWYDMIWMERILAPHPEDPEPFCPLPEVDQQRVAEILSNA